MTATRIQVLKDRYVDSVVQLSASRAMMDGDGVEWAAAAMGTPANLETLAGRGFDLSGVGATANDCFLAVQAGSDAAVEEALGVGEAALGGRSGGGGAGAGAAAGAGRERPRSLGEAAELLGDANLAIVSVPGDYAAIEAHKALSAGMHVLLFSDNVPLDQEVELKARAEAEGLLVMGPGAGTAMLGGTGLGFANVVGEGDGDGSNHGDGNGDRDGRPGVGVVAAAGTGAQEVMALLDRGGARVTAVIGVGGRDLS
ncbi:MAG TPA: protein FdrA, partial [Acidimicrobiia bacterium]|nr:protein FdrA [Acidimicrobiia bacterium]